MLGAIIALVITQVPDGAQVIASPGQSQALAVVAKKFPKPRLYHFVQTGALAQSADMCVDFSGMTKFFSKLLEEPDSKQALDKIAKGCTQERQKKGDGSTRVELVCDKSAGASQNTRMVMEGTIDDMRQHLESDPLPGLGEQKFVMDTHMTYIGACPWRMAPGDIRTADGKISNPLKALEKLGREYEAKKARSPAR